MRIPDWGRLRTGAMVPLGLGLIVLGAILLRFTGIGFLLPERTPLDGQVFAQEVEVLRSGRPDFDRGHDVGLYPQLVPRLVLLVPRPERTDGGPLSLEEHLDRASIPRRNLRVVIALLSVLAVPGTWALAKRFLDPTWALAAAALMATSFLHIWFSQQERPHAPATSFYVLAIVAALELRRNPCLWTFAFGGLAVGLAIGSLQSGAFVLPAFAAAVVLSGPGPSGLSWRSRAMGTLIALALVAISIRVFYPFFFETSGSGRTGLPEVDGSILHLSGHTISLRRFNGEGLSTVLWTMWTYEPLLLLLAVGGGILGLHRILLGKRPLESERKRDLIVVMTHALPYLGALILYYHTYQRFLIPLLPYAALLGASFLQDVSRAARGRISIPWLRKAAVGAIVAFPLATQAFCSAKLVSVRSAPDTLRLASAWIRANVRPGTDRIALNPGLDLPLMRSAGSLEANRAKMRHPFQPWFTYQCEIEPSECGEVGFHLDTIPMVNPEWRREFERDPAGQVRAHGWRYVVLDVYEDWGWKGFAALRHEIRRVGSLAAKFGPDPPGSSFLVPLEFQDELFPRRIHWLWRVLHAQRTGPVIEIYRMDT